MPSALKPTARVTYSCEATGRATNITASLRKQNFNFYSNQQTR